MGSPATAWISCRCWPPAGFSPPTEAATLSLSSNPFPELGRMTARSLPFLRAPSPPPSSSSRRPPVSSSSSILSRLLLLHLFKFSTWALCTCIGEDGGVGRGATGGGGTGPWNSAASRWLQAVVVHAEEVRASCPPGFSSQLSFPSHPKFLSACPLIFKGCFKLGFSSWSRGFPACLQLPSSLCFSFLFLALHCAAEYKNNGRACRRSQFSVKGVCC